MPIIEGMKEGDQILADIAAGNPGAAVFLKMRLDDGATEADIRKWYNISLRKREKILNTNLSRALIYTIALDKWGDKERAKSYSLARVPWLDDTSIHGSPPDLANPDRPLFCCMQPRVDRWFRQLRLRPCTNDELDQRMASEGHKTVNGVIRADMARGRF